MTIWKYPLSEVAMVPAGGTVRHVGLDPAGEPCVWIEVDPDLPKEERRFSAVGTGGRFVPIGPYVGTFVQPPFVWHIYEFRR